MVDTMRVQSGPADAPMSDEAFAPLADIYEMADGTTILEVELPGAGPDDVDIKVDKGVLTIQASTTKADLGAEYTKSYSAFEGGQYFRAFALSDEIDRDHVDASLSDGLLTLRLPKAVAARSRKIEIRTE